MKIFEELRRRNVFRVAVAYVVASWLLIQLSDILVPMLTLPDWVARFVFLLLVILFVPTLIAAWALEMTPEGIRLERNVDRDRSITPQTGRRLNNMIIAALALAVIVLLFDKLYLSASDPAVAGIKTDKSVAVLPFADLSQNQDQEWFADGLAEEILNALARAPDLLISARTSTFAYKGTDKDIRTIAGELGVAHVLEGSVRRAGDRIRVTAQLIRAADGFHVWSQNYDRDTKDVIEIQEDLAIQIASALETTMDPQALADMLRVGTRSAAAYQAFIHGTGLRARAMLENNKDLMRAAYAYFEEARKQDPDFSAAHGAAADYWVSQMTLTTFQMDTSVAIEAPEALLNEFYSRNDAAIATADNELDILRYRARRATIDMRLREAQRLYREFLDGRPNDIIAWEAFLSVSAKLSDLPAILEGLEFLREAGLTRPEAASYYVDYAYRYIDPGEAADYGLAAMQRWPRQNIIYQTHRSLLFANRIDEAAQVAQQYEQRYALHWLMRARQACAEDRGDVVREIIGNYNPGEIDAASIDVNNANPLWLTFRMIGDTESAEAVLRLYESPAAPYLLGSWLAYEHFDPRPFPALMAVIDRENIDRPPPIELPYACTRSGASE